MSLFLCLWETKGLCVFMGHAAQWFRGRVLTDVAEKCSVSVRGLSRDHTEPSAHSALQQQSIWGGGEGVSDWVRLCVFVYVLIPCRAETRLPLDTGLPFTSWPELWSKLPAEDIKYQRRKCLDCVYRENLVILKTFTLRCNRKETCLFVKAVGNE